MTNTELFAKAMVAGAGFMTGVAAVLFIGAILAIFIGCIASDDKR